MTSFITDPRPLDPPEYFDSVETCRAKIEYDCGMVEPVPYDETNTDLFYDEIVSTIQWAIENNEPLTIKIK